MRSALSITLITCTLLCTVQCVASHGARAARGAAAAKSPARTRTKEQQDFLAKLDLFKKQGQAAFSDEKAREKRGGCPHAFSTFEMVTCLGHEIEKTTANYKAYVGALHSVEGLKNPAESDEKGPGGQALSAEEGVTEFDGVEAAWQTYHKAQCTAAYDAYRPGTIAPVVELTCHLQLMRDHMRELENIYQLMN